MMWPNLSRPIDAWFAQKQTLNRQYIDAIRADDQASVDNIRTQIQAADLEEKQIRDDSRKIVKATSPLAETNDRDYVFITFILNHLPVGIIGLLAGCHF